MMLFFSLKLWTAEVNGRSKTYEVDINSSLSSASSQAIRDARAIPAS